jgi:hypothetical protein
MIPEFNFNDIRGQHVAAIAKVLDLLWFANVHPLSIDALVGALTAYAFAEGINPEDKDVMGEALLAISNIAPENALVLIAFASALAMDAGPAAKWDTFANTLVA